MANFIIKRNDLRKDLERTLVIDDSVVDLSSADTVEFHLNERPKSDTNILNENANIKDAANGVVEYQWADGDTDLEPRTYFYEFQVNWDNGDPQTFPNTGFKTLKIVEEGA